MRFKSFATKIVQSLVITFLTTLATTHQAYAQQVEWSGVCVGTGDGSDVATIQGLECLVGNIFTIVITSIGMVAFVMFIVGSLTWLTAGTNSSNIEKAKK